MSEKPTSSNPPVKRESADKPKDSIRFKYGPQAAPKNFGIRKEPREGGPCNPK